MVQKWLNISNFILFNLIKLPYFLKQVHRIPCVDDDDFSVSSYWLIIRFPFLLLQKYSKAVKDLSAYVIFHECKKRNRVKGYRHLNVL